MTPPALPLITVSLFRMAVPSVDRTTFVDGLSLATEGFLSAEEGFSLAEGM